MPRGIFMCMHHSQLYWHSVMVWERVTRISWSNTAINVMPTGPNWMPKLEHAMTWSCTQYHKLRGCSVTLMTGIFYEELELFERDRFPYSFLYSKLKQPISKALYAFTIVLAKTLTATVLGSTCSSVHLRLQKPHVAISWLHDLTTQSSEAVTNLHNSCYSFGLRPFPHKSKTCSVGVLDLQIVGKDSRSMDRVWTVGLERDQLISWMTNHLTFVLFAL